MIKQDLISRLVENHNRIASIEVRGDNAILVADTLRDLRNLVKKLQSESIQNEIDANE